MNPQRKHWYALGVRIDPVAAGRLIISHRLMVMETAHRQGWRTFCEYECVVIRYPDGTSLFAAFWPIPRHLVGRLMAYEKLAGDLRETHQRLEAGPPGP